MYFFISMNDAGLDVYRRRATQMADAMKLCMDDLTSYASAAVLLAVHSAISFNDALLIKLQGKRSKADDHRTAVNNLKEACGKAKIEPKGVPHLQKLLSNKTDVSYGNKGINIDQATVLCLTSERFRAWAERHLG
jgi:hypothetical protein